MKKNKKFIKKIVKEVNKYSLSPLDKGNIIHQIIFFDAQEFFEKTNKR